eukprot:Colp12_sorted_trinity150504_noHs@5633
MRGVLLALAALAVLVESAFGGLVLTNVKRTLDLTSQIVRETSLVSVKNEGSEATSSFVVAIEAYRVKNLSFLSVAIPKVGDLQSINVKEDPESGATLYTYKLDKELAGGETTILEIKSVFTHVQKPYPASIAQFDSQLMKYEGNHYFYSPYVVETQQTTVKLASSSP